MNIHEYLVVSRSCVSMASMFRKAIRHSQSKMRLENAKRLDTPVVVVKAQIHAGGRGEAGGAQARPFSG